METNQKNLQQEEEITIDLWDLLKTLWGKAPIIALAGIVCGLLAFIGTKTMITPMYDSVTKAYVISKQDANMVTAADLQTGTQLTKDYMELVKSRPVLEEVIAVLDLDMSVEGLANSIRVETPADTRILKITVRNEDPKMAKEIADEVRKSMSEQIKRVMNIDSVNTVEEANLPTEKASPSTMKNTALGLMLGVLISAGIIVVMHLLDDTIKTPEDVEKYLELNVLASLPLREDLKKTKKTRITKKNQNRKNAKGHKRG